ncbi:YceD family protein [Pseudooctadecabacter jejudonensis]|uniref:DUF177 domain-containing protein n=1 Tax=Pseudooctadecabacter jejudonensis TaxID=1391910 RepID=A0A1Y5RKM5_9RHOB|nr:DUF177 domain-containing protein [Pseudooctadecabacter jejudonensis]SLN18746.1 hypothetical protein PSJ8397_00625 [Pseudooctadecabacter jejudonensis]
MTAIPSHILRLADLPNRKRSAFTIEPDAAGRAALAETLDVLTIRKLRLTGAMIPMGKSDWRLEASLGATVQQACVITLEPVTTRIDEDIMRTYTAHFDVPDAAEVEMPEDDTTEPLPETLDLVAVMAEALALSLPPFPRKDGAEIGQAVFTEPGKAAMTDEDARPFAGLAALRAGLENKDDGDA